MRPSSSVSPDDHHRQFLASQLAEIDADTERGLLSETEAAQARLDLSRRLIRAEQTVAGTKTFQPAAAMLALAIAILAGSAFGLYAWLGSPMLADQPLAPRLQTLAEQRAQRPGQDQAEAAAATAQPPQAPADPADLDLLARLQRALETRPDDLRGHELLAENLARTGQFAPARVAMQKVIDIKKDQASSADYSSLAEFMILAAGGYVSPQAEAAIAEALRRDPASPIARYYSGLALAQGGRPDLTYRLWMTLLQQGPPDAPWIAPIEARIGEVAAASGMPMPESPTGPALAGPDEAAIDDAAAMTPEQRQQMITGMVESLSARLDSQGGTPAEWSQLIGALVVLGQTERAATSYSSAKALFADDPAALAELAAAAAAAGIQP